MPRSLPNALSAPMEMGSPSPGRLEPVGEVAAVLDLVHLSRQTFGDADLERDVLGLFLAQAQSTKNALAAATSDDQRRRLFHLIKGSARGIGATELAAAAEVAEQAPDSEADFAATLNAIERAGAAVSKLMAKP